MVKLEKGARLFVGRVLRQGEARNAAPGERGDQRLRFLLRDRAAAGEPVAGGDLGDAGQAGREDLRAGLVDAGVGHDRLGYRIDAGLLDTLDTLTNRRVVA